MNTGGAKKKKSVIKIPLPGQQKFKTLKEALVSVQKTLDTIHVQTHGNIKRSR